METLIDVFQYDWAIRALIASSLVGIVCGILGCFIVLRNMSMIGDALSHAILPGVVAGFIVAGHSVLAFFTGSVLAGLITAILITLIQRNLKTKEDAAIGIVFTSMFALGVIGISYVSRQEGVHLDMKDFLFGNVLGISDQDLWLTSSLTIYVILSVLLFYRYFFATTFQSVVAATMGINISVIHYFLMLLLSFTVVASLQSVGVILVVAMLIIPASTAQLLTNRLKVMLAISAGVGLLSACLGLLIAIVLQTTPGPAMTLTASFMYTLAVFFAPTKGLVPKYFISKKRIRKIQLEDVLKQAFRLSEDGELNMDTLSNKLSFGTYKLKSLVRSLQKKGLISNDSNKLQISQTGSENATRLIRAHRLWETYLVEQLGQSAEHIHDHAEKYEHVLTDQLLEEMEVKLGFPETDPHGSPIPKANTKRPLSKLTLNEYAIIPTDQDDEHIAFKIWQLGLVPNIPIQVVGINENQITIQQNNKLIKLGIDMASAILIENI